MQRSHLIKDIGPTRAVTRMLVTIVLLACVAGAHAALTIVEQAYEVEVNQVERWPLGDNGTIVLRPCGGCDAVSLSVTAQTLYRASQSSLNITREEMLQIKSMLSSRSDALVYIYYRPEDSTVTRIVLDAENR